MARTVALHTAAALVAGFNRRFAQSGVVDLQAGAARKDPDFGGEKLDDVQAVGVLSFNNAGKTTTAKALSHFLVLGQLVKEGELVELPDADFKRMEANGQVALATDDDKASK